MNKKGFTLIELLSVIIILSVIALISTPIISGVIEKSKQKAYERTVLSIEEASYNYSIYNDLGYNLLYKGLELSKIQEAGYLQSEDIIDPRNDEKLNGCVLYRWLPSSNQYDFKYQDSCDVESMYPEITINVLNDNNKEWMQEKLKFEINSTYSSYKYCVGNNPCTPDREYVGTTTLEEVGKDIYVCAQGYYDSEVGSAVCTKAYNIDDEKPEITINSMSSTSSKIIVNASCNDNISGMKNIEYSINNGNYQNSNIFTNLEKGKYTIKIRCIDNALNETMIEQEKETADIKAPTIAQLSQTPSNGDYAQKRIIRITFNGDSVESPEYYYSLNGKDWTKVETETYDVTFTSNGYLYAKTVDNMGNLATASTYTVTNIDTTVPSASIASISVKTDRATVKATCSDAESGISKYEFSKDNGSTWTSNGTTSSYTFTGLNQNTTYTFAIRCTNGSGLIGQESEGKTTSSITNPTIVQASATITSGYTWATSRVIKITYSSTGIQTPGYYFKSSVSATVASGVVTHSCGTSTNPGTCTASSVTTLVANTWYKTSSTTPSITYTSNGYLYAMTKDPKGNTANASTYTVSNTSSGTPTVPTITGGSTSWSSTAKTISISTASTETSGIKNYQYYISTSSTSVTGGSWTNVTGTSVSISTNGTRYIYFRAVANNGKTSAASAYQTTKIDTITPSAPTLTASDGITSGNWHTANFTITASGASNASGNTYYYKANQAVTQANGSVGSAYAANAETASYTYYVMVCSGVGKCSGNSSYTVKLDTSNPTVSASVSEKTATFTLGDNLSGVVGYGVNQSSTTAPTYTAITSATSATKTWTASAAGTYYVWVKDASGRTNKASFTIAASSFNYAATATNGNYTATATSANYTATQGDCSEYKCTLYKKCDVGHGEAYSSAATCQATCATAHAGGTCMSQTCTWITSGRQSECGTETVYGSECNNANSKTCNAYSYSCPNGGTLSGTTCLKTNYSCPNGGTLSGTTCLKTNYSCPNGGTLQGTTCVF